MKRRSFRSALGSFLCFAGWTGRCLLCAAPACTEEPSTHKSGNPDRGAQTTHPPKIDHILVEVSDLKASIAFYRDFIGLGLKSQNKDFVTLESGNIGVFLWSGRWDWEKPRSNGERQGLGMYPHFDMSDVAATVEKAREVGYRVVQEPRRYDWGTEAFIADPDGYTWALISTPK